MSILSKKYSSPDNFGVNCNYYLISYTGPGGPVCNSLKTYMID